MGTVVEYEFPSVKAFLIGSASTAAISVLNRSEFVTKPREFAVTFLMLSFYSVYLWIYALLRRGFESNVTDRWPTPTFFEAISLLFFNVGGMILAFCWVVESFQAKVDHKDIGDYIFSISYVDWGLVIVFLFYNVYLLGKTYRGGWPSVWKRIRATVTNPRKVILDQVRADASRVVEGLLSEVEKMKSSTAEYKRQMRTNISKDVRRDLQEIINLRGRIKELETQVLRKSV